MELVDDVAARDHVGGGEVFEGPVVGGVRGVDVAAGPDAEEGLGPDGLEGAADVRAGSLAPGDGVGLVGPEDVEPGCGGVPVGRDVSQDECAADVGVSAGVVEGGVGPVAGPGQGERKVGGGR